MSFRLRGGQPFQKRKRSPRGKAAASRSRSPTCGSPRQDGGRIAAEGMRASLGQSIIIENVGARTAASVPAAAGRIRHFGCDVGVCLPNTRLRRLAAVGRQHLSDWETTRDTNPSSDFLDYSVRSAVHSELFRSMVSRAVRHGGLASLQHAWIEGGCRTPSCGGGLHRARDRGHYRPRQP